MTDDPDLWAIARSLYATALRDFVAARNASARELKKAGDIRASEQVATFKKPSVVADLVNRFVRNGGDLLDEVLELGENLRAAQLDADAATLRRLDQERRALVGRVVAWARSEVDRDGGKATDAVLRDVEQTIWAAIVDAHAAAIVRAAVLVRPLSPGGFGEVDVAGASALDVDAPAEQDRSVRRRAATKREAPRPSAAETRARREASEALEQAQASAEEAQHELEEAARRSETADNRRTELEDERARLSAELAAVDRRLRETREAAADARAAVRTAEQQRRTAAAKVDRALRAVDRLGAGEK